MKDMVVKVVFVGYEGSGKSSIIFRYADKYFNGKPTVGVDFIIKKLYVCQK